MPNNAINKFTGQLILLSAILGLVSLIAYLVLPRISPAMPFLLLFIMSVTLLMHRYLLQSSVKKNNQFINRFLMMTTFKLVGYLGLITAYALINREDAVPFTVTFLAYYFIYSVFEVTSLLKYLKKSN
ncbi:MAG TPA: hypothetical protein DCR43_07260 [Bacteroidales bacterium]|nr:MAG: hypothetical protein A2X11_07905 [Bacteroidetes bacterium GWE2_42_24]OFY26442.1 MAG: hypothetical protein A2X09_02050 [Bacteroidetes bacterium GWF2_43_11]PKP25742.1 MAG: hypothetical protein CVU06_03965 [Bacteroidetes bacterium HGW-Bacteroidetes-22]HAQ65632.1 hypothetical protein [Bacteroidales bacterium]HBZ68159.1 hypothetical protein [Bacteroidales bacterium]